LLAAIAQRTKKIRLGTLVTNVNLRNPALLAKMASTLDIVSEGRLILGLGTGDKLSRGELESYGYKFASLEERVRRLRESILVLKSLWTTPKSTFKGQYYKLSDAVNLPKPIQKPHPPIWVGGKHRRILDIIAELADGWNYWDIRKENVDKLERYLQDKCREIGRHPREITKSWAGPIDGLFRARENRSAILETIRERLRDQVSYGTRYLIASFGPRAESWWYESFLEAARGLD
jgi:alkanesulfonate monooxygenase SsuD/methylene tetrahydromethanopterin reductase-like flavin-dependent oxidoreductase (luciferase family)